MNTPAALESYDLLPTRIWQARLAAFAPYLDRWRRVVPFVLQSWVIIHDRGG